MDYAGNMAREDVKASIRAGWAERVAKPGGKVEKAWLGQGMAKAAVSKAMTEVEADQAAGRGPLKRYPKPDMSKVTAFLRFRGMV